MSAEIETMFYTREKSWHGLGTMVAEAPESKEHCGLQDLTGKYFRNLFILK